MDAVITYLNLVFPLVGAAAVVYVYYLILIKRQQKLEIAEGKIPLSHATIHKLTDDSEQIWWILTMALVFIGYFGLILLYVEHSKSPRSFIKDAMALGLLFWPTLAYVGYRITKGSSGFFDLAKD